MSATVIEITSDKPAVLGQIVSYCGAYYRVTAVIPELPRMLIQLMSVTAKQAKQEVGDMSFIPSLDRYAPRD